MTRAIKSRASGPGARRAIKGFVLAGWLATGVASGALVGCAGSGGPSARRDLSELDIVECIVEGAVRQMGRNFAYQEPPRMARVTEAECGAMGGSFVLFDPARPESAIAKWLPFAESGDANAQYRLGQIYEGVMGAAPDYAKAAYWYGKGAESGHRQSTYSLGTLHEKGLGVEKDMLRALDLYRRSSGLEGDRLMLSSTAAKEIEAARAGLREEVATLAAQRDALTTQVQAMGRASARDGKDAQAQVAALQALVDDLNGKLATREQTLAAIPSYRMLNPAARGKGATRFDFPTLPAKLMQTRTVGKFYALVIGNNVYDQLNDLVTPNNDARRISDLLSKRYGMSTQLLLDANEEQIKRAIHRLNEVAEEDDNVLIYFAGHGFLRDESEEDRRRGYWLPTNADADQDVNWVDNWWVTNHLDAGKARRALVIADSCYGGVFSTDLPIGPVARLPAIADADLERKLERRGRFVLASGGVAPVLDQHSEGAQHSVFARAFIDVLEESKGSVSVIELYGRVFDRMYDALDGTGLDQEPELRVIRAAGHESEGDFFFVAN